MTVLYIDGRFQSSEEDNLCATMQVVNYGLAAFEGLKAFYLPDKKNWYIFRPDQHFQRLVRGSKMIDINLQMTEAEFVEVIRTLIVRNNIESDIYIRPIVFRNARGVGMSKPSGYGVSIFIQEVPFATNKEYRCCFVSQRRPTDGTYSGKLTGNYLLSFFGHKEALSKGYDVGILLSSDGYLSEASIMNLFFVDDGTLYTPSLECGPLDGITRRSIIQIAREQLGLAVKEGKYRQQRLLDADEVFFTGTGSGINYVQQIERKKFSLTRKKRIAPELWDLYQRITHGQEDAYSSWLIPVNP